MAKVVHIIDELKVGGAETHLATMLGHVDLAERACHHVIVLFGEGSIADRIRDLGVEVETLDLQGRIAGHRAVGAVGVIRNAIRRRRPDIVEAHLTYSRVLGLYAAWREGVPLRIAFEHGDLYLDTPKVRLGHFLGQRFAHRIIVVSEALAAWARGNYGLSPNRTFVLHNCVDVERFRVDAVVPATDLGLPQGATAFVAIGTLGTGINKRVDVLIRAVAEARTSGADVALAVCGDGEQRPALEQLAASLGVSDAVRFLGTRHDVPAVLGACDAFVLGTAFDPFPIAGLEAMAMGLPIVVPDTGGMIEAVDPGLTGLVYRALDHRALAVVMSWLHDHPKERTRMGQAARQSAEARFSTSVYMERLYAYYGTSADQQGGRHP